VESTVVGVSSPRLKRSETALNAALAMIEAAAPRDEIEGALAVQIGPILIAGNRAVPVPSVASEAADLFEIAASRHASNPNRGPS
jgi:hypothetical protein